MKINVKKPSKKTWGASLSLSNGEFLMRGATVTAGFSGKDGGLCQSLSQSEREGTEVLLLFLERE